MDAKKYEKLIDLIINENEEAARDLFHEIVVDKSREIYESYMMDDMAMEEDPMASIMADEMAMEGEDDLEAADDDMMDMDADEADMEADAEDYDDADAALDGEEGDLEDRVVDLEDKLDELMAEFESMMGDDSDSEDMEMDAGEEEMMESEDDEDDTLEESVSLNPVKGLYGSKIGGDDGAQTKSPTLTKPKVIQTGANPVKFSGGSDEKGRTAPTTKDVDGASSFKNLPGKDGFKNDGKGEAVKKPTTTQAAGVNKQSVVAKQ